MPTLLPPPTPPPPPLMLPPLPPPSRLSLNLQLFRSRRRARPTPSSRGSPSPSGGQSRCCPCCASLTKERPTEEHLLRPKQQQKKNASQCASLSVCLIFFSLVSPLPRNRGGSWGEDSPSFSSMLICTTPPPFSPLFSCCSSPEGARFLPQSSIVLSTRNSSCTFFKVARQRQHSIRTRQQQNLTRQLDSQLSSVSLMRLFGKNNMLKNKKSQK